jgi:transcriptional regulator with XRE-family HTH domain
MLPVQSKMARVALGLGIRDLAQIAQVAPATVSRFEAGEELKPRTVMALRTALESAGAIFVDENADGPGVILRKTTPNSSV